LGFGDHWNQDILEQIADVGGGTLSCSTADQAVEEFGRLFNRMQAVGLTNAYLLLSRCLKCWQNSNQSLVAPIQLSYQSNKKLMDACSALGRLDERCAAGSLATCT